MTLLCFEGALVLIPTLWDPNLDCEYCLSPAEVISLFEIVAIIKIGSTGIVLGYCKDDEMPLNSTASPPTTRLPLPKFRN